MPLRPELFFEWVVDANPVAGGTDARNISIAQASEKFFGPYRSDQSQESGDLLDEIVDLAPEVAPVGDKFEIAGVEVVTGEKLPVDVNSMALRYQTDYFVYAPLNGTDFTFEIEEVSDNEHSFIEKISSLLIAEFAATHLNIGTVLFCFQ
jgi:hypothetical protein